MNAKSIYSPSVLQLLSLVRASLWRLPPELGPFIKYPANWDEIGRLSMQQTVGALTIESAFSLPSEFAPPKPWINKGMVFLERNRRTHSLLDHCITDVFAKLKEADISPILLKGQAYARAYPHPALRQCGDIDIYVGERAYRHAYEATVQYGWESDVRFVPDAKHYSCSFNGARIELHRVAAQLPSRKANRKFQKWSREQIVNGEHKFLIDGNSIPVPTPLFDVVFVFTHMFYHFMSSGIGLRHICDWTMLLHKHYNSINQCELEKCLRDFKLLKAWRLFSPIAVDILGLPASECPFYSPKYCRKSDEILSFIFKEGNFGRAKQKKTKRPEGYISGKFYSFIKQTQSQYSKFIIDPLTVIRYHNSFVYKGIRAILKDLTKIK